MASVPYSLVNFNDIVTAIAESLKVQQSDNGTLNRIRRNVNMVYLNHVIPAANSWGWLRKTITLSTDVAFTLGTASVTQNSSVVTLSEIPSNSKSNYYITFQNVPGIYKIASHAAASAQLQLETNYNGPTNPTIRFKIWADFVRLPSDCMMVKEVISSARREPLDGLDISDLRKHQIAGHDDDGRGVPLYYAETGRGTIVSYEPIPGIPSITGAGATGLVRTITFASDVSALFTVGQGINVEGASDYTYNGDQIISGINGNTISYKTTKQRNTTLASVTSMIVQERSVDDSSETHDLILHPPVNKTIRSVNLLIDYQIRPASLVNLMDEPLIPLEHRIVLFYGGMWLSCDRETDSERSESFFQLMEDTIQKMLNLSRATPKMPKIKPSMDYYRRKG